MSYMRINDPVIDAHFFALTETYVCLDTNLVTTEFMQKAFYWINNQLD